MRAHHGVESSHGVMDADRITSQLSAETARTVDASSVITSTASTPVTMAKGERSLTASGAVSHHGVVSIERHAPSRSKILDGVDHDEW
jgi:hypothetical protein